MLDANPEIDRSNMLKDFVIYRNKKTTLQKAAMLGLHNLVIKCIPKEAGLVNAHGRTALMLAVKYENWECVKELIPYEKKIANIQNRKNSINSDIM